MVITVPTVLLCVMTLFSCAITFFTGPLAVHLLVFFFILPLLLFLLDSLGLGNHILSQLVTWQVEEHFHIYPEFFQLLDLLVIPRVFPVLLLLDLLLNNNLSPFFFAILLFIE